MKPQKKPRPAPVARKTEQAKTPVEKQPLASIAYDLIRRDIITCKLKPGAVMSEAKLAEAYSLGLAPIRNALSRLAQGGLVTVQPRSGNVVAPVTLQSIRDVFDMRAFLEPSAAARAAGNLTPAEIEELERLCDIDYVHADPESTAAFIQANKSFHMLVASGARNERLLLTLGHLLDEMERLVHLGLLYHDRSQEHQSEHRDVLEAIKQGASERAEKLMQKQIDDSLRMVLNAAISSSGLSRINIA